MGGAGLRGVRRNAVSIELVRPQGRVLLRCSVHDTEQSVSMEHPAFGRLVVAFFTDHEACSHGKGPIELDTGPGAAP